jgi:HK97 gp10 family phage protein
VSVNFRVEAGRGAGQSFRKLSTLAQGTKRSIRQGWFSIGRNLSQEANREILRKPKSGRVYFIRRGGRRFRHIASAPFETHANITGKARRSVSWKVHGTDSMDFGYGVSTTAKNAAPIYAPFLEFGTRKMAPRPSLSNAIVREQRNSEVEFERSLAREMGVTQSRSFGGGKLK